MRRRDPRSRKDTPQPSRMRVQAKALPKRCTRLRVALASGLKGSFVEIVAAVGGGKKDPGYVFRQATGAAPGGGTVAANRFMENLGPGFPCDLGGIVSAPIIDDAHEPAADLPPVGHGGSD